MKNHRNLLIYFLLAAVFIVPFSTPTASAQDEDAVEIIYYGNATYVYYYGYDQQKLPPTKYPYLEQIGQNIIKIWGAPYLTTKDQICFSYVNTSQKMTSYSYNYDIEVELNDQWYLVLSEYCTYAISFRQYPGRNYNNSVREDSRQKLFPGKYRIITGLDYGEFEIVEPGSDLPEKPTAYDWQFLDRTSMSIVERDTIQNTEKYLYDKAEQDGLKIITVENQPITTSDEFLYFTVDLETDFIPFWKDFCIEVKINGMWRVLGYYDMGVYYIPDLNNQMPYFAYYRMGLFRYITPIVLTPKMISFPRLWAPAGPFAGEHRICGNLFVGAGKTVLAYGEFEVVEVPEPIIAAAGASAWALGNVQDAISAGLVPQNLQEKYQQSITRAEFAALALAFLKTKAESYTIEILRKKNLALDDGFYSYKAETGLSTIEILRHRNLAVDDGVFSDTNDYYVLAAQALGIVEGIGEGLFDPDGNITREQLATMLVRTQSVLDDGAADVADVAASAYSDRNLFSPWGIPSIDLITAQSIMSGVGDNRFDPKGNCTREQAIVTFVRMNNYIDSTFADGL
ncbi:MAG: S-layer homology domain-containing protein [Firmicutes bacterium]|nr:S-layer homology domain-containing protein [Bacillota bacterium]